MNPITSPFDIFGNLNMDLPTSLGNSPLDRYEPEMGPLSTTVGGGVQSIQNQKPGMDWASLIPQMVAAFSAGQAARQRNPQALMSVVSDLMQMQESKRRGRLQDEASRRAADREERLGNQYIESENRKTTEAQFAREANTRKEEANQRTGLANYANQVEDNLRAMTQGGRKIEGPALQEWIDQQARLYKTMGGDADALRARLLSTATLGATPLPDKPVVAVRPGGQVPSSIPANAAILSIPQPREPREAPSMGVHYWTDRNHVTWKIITNPKSGQEVSRERVGEAPEPSTGGLSPEELGALGLKPQPAHGAAPTAPPAANVKGTKSVTRAQVEAVARKNGTTYEAEKKRAESEGFIVR